MKKIIKKINKVKIEEPKEEVVIQKIGITQISTDMGREDLNRMAEKINEIITFINK